MTALIDRMNTSILVSISRAYRANPPVMAEDAAEAAINGVLLAQDASAAADLQVECDRLAKKWQSNFKDAAADLARDFTSKSQDRADRMFTKAAKKAGMTVKFKMTPTMQDAYSATIAEQVGLIKSIPQQHLAKVQGIVMRSVQSGRDLGTLSDQLQKQFKLTKKRAALIARDQNNKATAILTRVRQLELAGDDGKAVWCHSSAGKHKRPKHVAADGKTYSISKGLPIADDGGYTWPGVEINCRCFSRIVI